MKRIYHTWDKWECFRAGFFEDKAKGMTKEQAEAAYKDFLTNETAFRRGLQRVITEWKFSCEHNLTNENMNRIAWLGQAAMCIETGVPSAFRSGFNLLSEQQQKTANAIALEALNQWLTSNGHETVENVELAASKTEMNLY